MHAHGNIEQTIIYLSWLIITHYNILYTVVRGLLRNAVWRKMGKQLRLLLLHFLKD